MSTTEPTDEMVEAAAEVFYDSMTGTRGRMATSGYASAWRAEARNALRAALAVAPAPSDTASLDDLLRSIIWDPKYGDDKHWMFANLSAALRLSLAPAPTEDDREALIRAIITADVDWEGQNIGTWDRGAQVADAVFAWLARRSPVSPPEDVTKLIEAVLRGVESALVESESRLSLRSTLLRRAVSAAIRASVPMVTVGFDGGTTFALTGENAGHWVEGAPTLICDDYYEIFGKRPEVWREPLGALRLTLNDETNPPWQLERARDECEELVRVLNGVTEN